MTEPLDIEPGQPCAVRRFEPRDAYGVVRLFRSVYGDGYPVKTYMSPELLRSENEALRVISSVAVTPRGDVVGHNSLFRSAPNPNLYESGAGLVHEAYRGGKGIGARVVAHGLKLAETIGLDAVMGEPVCNHLFMQKLTAKMGFIVTALEVDLMPAEAYEAEKSATGRVAALLSFRIFSQAPQQVFLPRFYADVFPLFYEGTKREVRFSISETGRPVEGLSDITHEVFDFAGVARIAVRSVGGDFTKRMERLEKSLKEKGVVVFQAWLNLADPANSEAVESLQKSGYFLGGVLPLWFGSDGLLMQKILKVPDWDGIHLDTKRCRRMLEKIQADWLQFGKGGSL